MDPLEILTMKKDYQKKVRNNGRGKDTQGKKNAWNHCVILPMNHIQITRNMILCVRSRNDFS